MDILEKMNILKYTNKDLILNEQKQLNTKQELISNVIKVQHEAKNTVDNIDS